MCPWCDLSRFSTNFLIKAQIPGEQHSNLISECLGQRAVQPVPSGSQGPCPIKENAPHVSSGRKWWGVPQPWKKAEARKVCGVICSSQWIITLTTSTHQKEGRGEKVTLMHGHLCDGMDGGCSIQMLKRRGKKRSSPWAPICLPEWRLSGDKTLPWLVLSDPAAESRNSPLSCLPYPSAALSFGWHAGIYKFHLWLSVVWDGVWNLTRTLGKAGENIMLLQQQHPSTAEWWRDPSCAVGRSLEMKTREV